MIGEKQKHGNLAGIIHWSKSFAPFIMNALFSTHSATLHSGRLTTRYTARSSARSSPKFDLFFINLYYKNIRNI